MKQTETTTEVSQTPSRKQVVGATVAGTFVAVVLGMVSSYGVGKASQFVSNKINPPVNNTNNTAE